MDTINAIDDCDAEQSMPLWEMPIFFHEQLTGFKSALIEQKISKRSSTNREMGGREMFNSHAQDVNFSWCVGRCIFSVMQFKHHDGVIEKFPFLACMPP